MSPRRFKAMGCEIVVGGATPSEQVAVERLFAALEASLSRFRPTSDLERLNRSPAGTVIVSPLLATALDDALRAAQATDGLCDPTIAAALRSAGYDRTFAEIAPGPLGEAVPAGRWREIRLSGLLVQRPVGLRLDLNGVVKGRAVDDALALLEGDGFVSAGGDLAARGSLVVALPAGGTVTLDSGALATSGTTTRSWAREGDDHAHHLIDPATGLPADVRWQAVTVCAGTCLAADVAAKSAFLLGDDGPAWLERQGLQGRFVAETEVVLAGGWPEKLGVAGMHLVASTTVWYAARAGGVVSYVLVSASVLAGILLAGKARVPGLPRFAVEDVHRFLGLLAGLFIAIHVGSIALDTVVPFSLTQLVIPFTSSYRPLATGLGIVAVELLLAVAVTNRLRSRLPYRIWRRAHYATLVVWLLATVHGILSGTDRSQTWLLAVYATTVALVVGAAVLRFGRAPTPRRLATGLAVAAGAAVVVLGLSALPQQASKSKSSTTVAATTVPDLNGTLTGTIDQGDGSGIVSISGTAASQSFRIDLLTGGNTVADTALQLRFASGTLCEGTLTALDDTGFTGTCTLPGGGTRTVTSTWTVSNGTVDGTLSTTGGSSSSADA